MADLAELGFRVDTGDLKKGQRELGKFAASSVAAAKEVDKFGNELTQHGKAAGRFIDASGRMREANGRFVVGLKNSSSQAAAFSGGLSSIDSAANNASAAMAALTGIAGGYSVSLANSVKEQQAWADATGVSLEVLQEWSASAKTVGRDVGFIGDVFKDTSEKIGDFAATGGGEASDVFEQLGIAVEDIENLSPDQQLLKIAAAIDQVGTRGEKLFLLESLANDASLLLPLLEDNAAGLNKISAQARELGSVIDRQDADKLLQLSENWTKATQAATGFGNRFAAQYSGDVSDALASFANGAQAANRFVSENSEAIEKTAEVLAGAALGYAAFTLATKASTAAMVVFNTAASANPLGILVRGASLAAGAFVLMQSRMESSEDVLQRVTDKAAAYTKTVDQMSRSERESAISAKEAELARVEASSDLNEQLQQRANLFRLAETLRKNGHEEASAAVEQNLQKIDAEIGMNNQRIAKAKELREELQKLKGLQITENSDQSSDPFSGGVDTEKAQQVIDKLREKSELMKLTSEQQAAYNVRVAGGNEEMQKEAANLQRIIDLEQARIDKQKASEQASADLMSMRQSLQMMNISNLEQESARNAQVMQQIESWRQQDLISHQEYLDAKADAERAHASEVQRINIQSAQTILGATGQFFGNMAAIAQEGGQEQFQRYKNLASAQAGISAAMAALSVLGDPNVPTFLKPPLMASIGALAAVQVASIQSESYGGGRYLGGHVSEGKTYTVGEDGPERITMGGSGVVTPNHRISGGGGDSVTIVNNVQTGVQDTIRAEMAQMMPLIQQQVIGALGQKVNRGGAAARMVGRR